MRRHQRARSAVLLLSFSARSRWACRCSTCCRLPSSSMHIWVLVFCFMRYTHLAHTPLSLTSHHPHYTTNTDLTPHTLFHVNTNISLSLVVLINRCVWACYLQCRLLPCCAMITMGRHEATGLTACLYYKQKYHIKQEWPELLNKGHVHLLDCLALVSIK